MRALTELKMCVSNQLLLSFRGLCQPDFYCGLFHYLNWTLILIADFSIYLIRRTEINSGVFRLSDFGYWFLHLIWGARRVRTVGRGCLLLLGTWSHLRYIRRSMLVHLFIWRVIPTCVLRLITLWYLSHFINWINASYNSTEESNNWYHLFH
jgi:hypothetical protein